MAKFVDEIGREWLIKLTTNKMRMVRDATGYDLARMFTPKGLESLLDDVILLVDVLALLCREQMEHRKITEEEFAEALVGDALESATYAMIQGGIDFLPQARRQAPQEMWARLQEIGQAQQALAIERIRAIDVDSVVKMSSGPSSAELPESPELIQAPGVLES